MEKYAIIKCTIKLKGEYIMKRKITIGIAAAAVKIGRASCRERVSASV